MNKKNNDALFDVAGIGNAIVDVLMTCTEDALAKKKLVKGTMTLVAGDRAADLYQSGGSSRECSGGSVANTLAGMASLGAKTAFIGKVSNDQFGSVFVRDMHAEGVHFSTPAANGGPATAICLVFVTPDAQRTMATHIGACSLISDHDVDASIIENAAITYIEGYLWDTENAKSAIRKAMKIAHEHGRKIAFTLSDVFCVDRHRDEFLKLIESEIDILFANEAELKSLYQTDDIDAALKKIRGVCEIVAVTRSEKGSVVLTAKSIDTVPAQKVARVIDTTGAGDLYAAGFLYGLTRGMELKACAKIGNACAAEIITQFGARSLRPLKELVA
jgi:sugar/nucleoside kinase (ribokinase family)